LIVLSAYGPSVTTPASAEEQAAANGQTPTAAPAGQTPAGAPGTPSVVDYGVSTALLQSLEGSSLDQLDLPDLGSLTPVLGRQTNVGATADWRVSPVIRGISAAKPRLPLPAVPQASEKALGMAVGWIPGVSFSTELASSDGRWSREDTRMGWSLTRQAPTSVEGFVWGGAASGGIDAQGKPNQEFAVSLGLRRSEDDGAWRVTPEVQVSSTYEAENASRWGTTVKPSLAASARVFQSERGWLEANIDTRVGYAIPVEASSTGGLDASAMLRLTFKGLQ
jgi:hypothetical protein